LNGVDSSRSPSRILFLSLPPRGVWPETAQVILRHGKIDLTVSAHTHTLRGQESEAVAKLPDLSLPSSEDRRKGLDT